MARKINTLAAYRCRPSRSLDDEIHLTTLGYYALVIVVSDDGSHYDFPAFSTEHARQVLKTHTNVASYAIWALHTSETTRCVVPITNEDWGQLQDAWLAAKRAKTV